MFVDRRLWRQEAVHRIGTPVWLGLLIGSFLTAAPRAIADDGLLAGGQWKRNGLATPWYEIEGTGGRNNSLRRPLREPYLGDELFVRYRLRYRAETIDTPADGDGEFFVLWLDDAEGDDFSTHSQQAPNLGLHVNGQQNRFMARYHSSGEKFSAVLQGDREFLVVGRLWKSTPGDGEPFDCLDLWIDPAADDERSPDASVTSQKAISEVRWIGFSTGAKTEIGDKIAVGDVELAATWHSILGLPSSTDPAVDEPVAAAQRTVHFAEHVYPILKTHCFECHAGSDATEGVRLDAWDDVLNQVTPYNARDSRLFQLVTAGEMPPDGEPLDAAAQKILAGWIDEGVDWDETLLPTPVPTTDHWAFQPIDRPAIPAVSRSAWVRTPVDAFIARRHEQLGVAPAAEADAATLRRRISLDLTGLPPAPDMAEVSASELDTLLTSQAYGERWGRHWLDVARWAESNGHQHNRNRPHAWRYRDWVVDAFSSGKPYDQFIRQQIAGDQMTPLQNDHLIATGFLAAARYSGNELDKEIQRNDILVDIVNTTAGALLGLTLECAQCHIHKFDPLTIRDYYRFQAFFATGQPGNLVLADQDSEAGDLIDQRWQIFDTVHDRLVTVKRKQGHPEPIYVIRRNVIKGMKPQEKARFDELEQAIGRLRQTWGFYAPDPTGTGVAVAPHDMRWPLPRESETLAERKTRLLIRGDVGVPGPEVGPGWPAVFGPTPASRLQPRKALADWIASGDNPLTARVWVNRIWQWHFGRGLVASSNDFGTQGARPTHPDLLDFLASELIDSGWSTRHIHRLILNSATYRQSSEFSADNAAIDPENVALWRWTPRRLEAEAVRDAMLAVSGQLDGAWGGPSVDAESNRRSLYLRQRRDELPYQQMLFDGATGIVSCAQRRVSTNPLQPLWLMNSRQAQQAAAKLAERAGSVERAILLAVHREPTPGERQHLNGLAEAFGLQSACLAILNSSEFLYIP